MTDVWYIDHRGIARTRPKSDGRREAAVFAIGVLMAWLTISVFQSISLRQHVADCFTSIHVVDCK